MTKALKIVLIGLPGSGKSTFGRHLANSLEFPYADLDHLIEKKYRMKIPDIFAQLGEGKFRQWETEILREFLAASGSYILSSGGGCPCFNDNMELINRNAISVYLDVPLEEISARLSGSKTNNRPMFEGLDLGEIILKLKSLLVERDIYYNMAKIKLSGEDFSAELLASELLGLIKNLD